MHYHFRADIEEATNTLATAAHLLFVARVRFAGYLMALKSNGLEVTQARMTPYIDDLNAKIVVADSAARSLATLLGRRRPRAAKGMKFSAKVRCTVSCTHAKGLDCVCSCGGANHGLGRFAAFAGTAACA